MTPNQQRICIVGIPLTAIALVVGGVVFPVLKPWDLSGEWQDAVVGSLGKPHVLPEPDSGRWARLKVNMTKTEVRQLLGNPPSTRCHKATHSNYSDEALQQWERWTWGFSEGLDSLEVHEISWVIYFNREGKVTSFRLPLVVQKSSP